MKNPIEFLNKEYAGKTGVQVVTDDTHEVDGVYFDDGTEVPDKPAYSYRLIEE
jgi:hypothetical protein